MAKEYWVNVYVKNNAMWFGRINNKPYDIVHSKTLGAAYRIHVKMKEPSQYKLPNHKSLNDYSHNKDMDRW